MSKRRRAREMAVQMLYQSDLGGADGEQVVAAFDPLEMVSAEIAEGDGNGLPAAAELGQAFEYARRLVHGALSRREEIDEMIRRQAEHWRLERMPAVDRNILRLAVYELLSEADVPQLVVLDEAIELAKKYGSEQSSAFVNGLLDGMLKEHEFPGSRT